MAFVYAWRPHLVENCPPESSKPANVTVYRFTDGRHIRDRDFYSYAELGRHPQNTNRSECELCGLSVYTKLDDIKRMKINSPALRRKRIMRGDLSPDMGKILHTPSMNDSHHTWWVAATCSPNAAFVIVTEE